RAQGRCAEVLEPAALVLEAIALALLEGRAIEVAGEVAAPAPGPCGRPRPIGAVLAGVLVVAALPRRPMEATLLLFLVPVACPPLLPAFFRAATLFAAVRAVAPGLTLLLWIPLRHRSPPLSSCRVPSGEPTGGARESGPCTAAARQ